MKPPKINKLSKKQLKKLYSRQWNANNELAGENVHLKNQSDTWYKLAASTGEQLIEVEKELDYKNRLLQSLVK